MTNNETVNVYSNAYRAGKTKEEKITVVKNVFSFLTLVLMAAAFGVCVYFLLIYKIPQANVVEFFGNGYGSLTIYQFLKEFVFLFFSDVKNIFEALESIFAAMPTEILRSISATQFVNVLSVVTAIGFMAIVVCPFVAIYFRLSERLISEISDFNDAYSSTGKAIMLVCSVLEFIAEVAINVVKIVMLFATFSAAFGIVTFLISFAGASFATADISNVYSVIAWVFIVFEAIEAVTFLVALVYLVYNLVRKTKSFYSFNSKERAITWLMALLPFAPLAVLAIVALVLAIICAILAFYVFYLIISSIPTYRVVYY